ncbi:MAG: hypothetical protein AB7G28_11900 [Pirellulales bacterium]
MDASRNHRQGASAPTVPRGEEKPRGGFDHKESTAELPLTTCVAVRGGFTLANSHDRLPNASGIPRVDRIIPSTVKHRNNADCQDERREQSCSHSTFTRLGPTNKILSGERCDVEPRQLWATWEVPVVPAVCRNSSGDNRLPPALLAFCTFLRDFQAQSRIVPENEAGFTVYSAHSQRGARFAKYNRCHGHSVEQRFPQVLTGKVPKIMLRFPMGDHSRLALPFQVTQEQFKKGYSQ